MRKNILLTLGPLVAFLLVQSSPSLAGFFDVKKSIEGTIAEIQANLISLRPKMKASGEMNQEAKINITVNADTKFKDVALTELRKGDPVRVEYKEDSGSKVAIQVEKVENSSEQSKHRG